VGVGVDVLKFGLERVVALNSKWVIITRSHDYFEAGSAFRMKTNGTAFGGSVVFKYFSLSSLYICFYLFLFFPRTLKSL